MSDDEDEPVHSYRVRLPSYAEARRIRGLEPHVPDHPVDDTPIRTILHGAFGPPCVHCCGVSEALCDFPLGAEGRTCDRALCLECAPTTGRDENYCREHAEHGPGMLLFQPRPPPPKAAPRRRAQPLPRKPPEPNRWRVLQGRGDPDSYGAALTGWKPELDARRFAAKVGGIVETWDEFVRAHRALYPLAPRRRR
jgi:hypothetical protein